ncbi:MULTISPECIES: hypothetical protein [unclassified Pseudomonas]|uniref:hypothetical protein n=1 Tax=unclassified Pseudomonas TaxID=196821 RepID=UPI00244B6B03|nr:MULTISPECIES: hypothetical protein [unclassified Pseudomonas]MDH0894226.1 hypothetical protein [Pseudomonas sp. GD03875]MDH1063479.1 hypothetical protein [Pseudomonas sp. GD03985]
MGGFSDLVDDMDDMVMDSLSDGVAQYLSRTGAVLRDEVPVIVELAVERVDDLSGGVDRMRTHCVQKRLLQPLDLKGSFLMDAKRWHIDGIADDDGDLITFYVVP